MRERWPSGLKRYLHWWRDIHRVDARVSPYHVSQCNYRDISTVKEHLIDKTKGQCDSQSHKVRP